MTIQLVAMMEEGHCTCVAQRKRGKMHTQTTLGTSGGGKLSLVKQVHSPSPTRPAEQEHPSAQAHLRRVQLGAEEQHEMATFKSIAQRCQWWVHSFWQ